jgi:hypothetical protein
VQGRCRPKLMNDTFEAMRASVKCDARRAINSRTLRQAPVADRYPRDRSRAEAPYHVSAGGMMTLVT